MPINSNNDPTQPRKPRAPRKDKLETLVWFPNQELLSWVNAKAAANERTLSAEIIFRLKQAMKWELRRGEKGRFKKMGPGPEAV